MNLIGKKAPPFKATAVVNGNEIVQDFSLQPYINKQPVLLFFYPKDFTFVCPTELLTLQRRSQEFYDRNTAIVACSTDTEETHLAWLNTHPNEGGINGVTYPLIADTAKTIASNFGVLGGSWYIDDDDQMQFQGTPIAYRGTFLIDKKGIIRHILINDLSLGRSIDELLRTIDMIHHVETHGEVCPVEWQVGKRAFKPTTEGLLHYVNHPSCKETGCECKKSLHQSPTMQEYNTPPHSCQNGNCQCR